MQHGRLQALLLEGIEGLLDVLQAGLEMHAYA